MKVVDSVLFFQKDTERSSPSILHNTRHPFHSHSCRSGTSSAGYQNIHTGCRHIHSMSMDD